MYILIDYIHLGKKKTMAYENFQELKEAVLDELDRTGWVGKKEVDLRCLWDCVFYLARATREFRIKKSKSFKKFLEYRYGEKAENF